MNKPYNIPSSDSKAEKAGTMIAQKLINLCNNAAFSRTDIANKSGVNLSQIRCLENGTGRPDMLVCLKLAAALGINFSDIVLEVENRLLE